MNLRRFHRVAPLLRSLCLGVVTTASIGLAPMVLVGCADEEDPATHLERLDDPRTAPVAVKRLVQFFEDAMSKDKGDRNGPNVKPVLDAIVPKMTEVCVDPKTLNDRARSQLIRFLADARDERAEACYLKVLEEYKPDENEEDIGRVLRAVTAMELKSAGPKVLNVFKTIKVAKPKAGTIYRDVNAAMLELSDASMEGELVKLLERPIADLNDLATLKNEAFWQITAAEVLGNMKSEKAVVPLMKIVLSPLKADMAPTAVNALIKIGKPAIGPAVELMNNKHEEMMTYSKEENLKVATKDSEGNVSKEAKEAAEKAHIGAAAIILGTIGRQEAADALVKALPEANDLTKAIIARELPKLPADDKLIESFKETYEKTPLDLNIPPGNWAREELLTSAATFFEPSLVPWIVDTAKNTKGDQQDLDYLRQVSLQAAMKLMKKDQIDLVKELYEMKIPRNAEGKESTVGKAFEKEWKQSVELLEACGDKIECYVAKLGDVEANKEETQFTGIKAAYMIGGLGGPEVRDQIIEQFPRIDNAAVRFVAVSVIDRESPNGDAGIADKLQKIVDDAVETKDQNQIQSNAPFKPIIYRLRARAQ